MSGMSRQLKDDVMEQRGSDQRATAALAAVLVAVTALAGCESPAPSLLEVSDTPAAFGAHEASLSVLTDGYAVAWYDTRDGHPEIYARILDTSGQPAGPARRLTVGTDAAYEADLVSDGVRLIVGWYEKSDSDMLTPMLGVWSREGERQWATALAASGRNTAVDVRGETIFAAWIQDDTATESSVWAGWWSTAGDALATPMRLAPAGRTTWNLNATLDIDATAWLVFDAMAETQAEELFLVRTHLDGVPTVRQLTRDDGFRSKYPAIALFDDRTAVTWFDERDGNQEVYVAVAPAAELGAGLEDVAHRVTDTPGHSIGAYLDWNADRLGLAWSDDSGGQHDVFFQAFDAFGRKVGDERQVTRTPAASLIPAIRPWQTGFILAWNETDLPAGAAGQSGTLSSRIVSTLIP
jgi:hypothetical protein